MPEPAIHAPAQTTVLWHNLRAEAAHGSKMAGTYRWPAARGLNVLLGTPIGAPPAT